MSRQPWAGCTRSLARWGRAQTGKQAKASSSRAVEAATPVWSGQEANGGARWRPAAAADVLVPCSTPITSQSFFALHLPLLSRPPGRLRHCQYLVGAVGAFLAARGLIIPRRLLAVESSSMAGRPAPGWAALALLFLLLAAPGPCVGAEKAGAKKKPWYWSQFKPEAGGRRRRRPVAARLPPSCRRRP